MLNLKKIAVTGGLASGKTTVCRYLGELGAYVVSADAIVHQLLSSDAAIKEQVIGLLGTEIVSDRQLNRQKIAEQVFSHPDKLVLLEKILHPAVLEEIEKKYKQVKKEKKYSLFIAEIPLLYESESEHFYDRVVSVTADPALCQQRYTQPDFEKRMQRQLPLHYKTAKAHYTIENNGNLDDLKKNVLALYSQLIEI